MLLSEGCVGALKFFDIEANGYGFLIEMVYRAWKQDGRLREPDYFLWPPAGNIEAVEADYV